jgi:ketosteroid isomerase-like protein
MSQENVEIVRRAMEAYVRGDTAGALADVDPDIVWNPNEEPAGRGHNAVLSSLQGWEETWEDYSMRAEEYLDAGNKVVAALHFTGRGKASGVEVDARSYQVHTIREGKIVQMIEFTDRADALEAAGLSE